MATALTVIIQPLIFLAVLAVSGFVLAVAMTKISRWLQKTLIRLIGVRSYLLFFGWLGTAVHELSHAAMCLVFGHKIYEMKLFRLDLSGNNGGYVCHSYKRNSLRQRLGSTFISIAPLFGGAFVLWLSARLLVPGLLGPVVFHPSPIDAFVHMLVVVPVQTFISLFSWSHWVDFKFYVFLYVLVSVGCSLRLSTADLKNAVKGAGTLFLAAYCVFFVIILVDREFDLQYMYLVMSAACSGYALLVMAIMVAALLLGPLLGILKMLAVRFF
jgi:hypothetical protein